MKYIFARNINEGNVSGIIDLEKQRIVCLCSEDNSKLILQALNEHDVMDYTQKINIEYKDHDKVVLTNENGDTYTSMSEELMDFLHGIKILNIPVVTASAFVEKCATMAEYIDGKHYDNKYKSSWIAVIEYQELLKAAKEFDNEH